MRSNKRSKGEIIPANTIVQGDCVAGMRALPDGIVGWWRSGGPARLLAMVGWPPPARTYPELDLDPVVQAEKQAFETWDR